MSVRSRRLGALLGTAGPLFLVIFVTTAWCQKTPQVSPQPEPLTENTQLASGSPQATGASLSTVQEGLPPELKIETRRLDQEQKALESALVYIRNTKPSGNIFARAGRAVYRFLSGERKPQALTLDAIALGGNSVNGKLVSVEGLVQVGQDGQESLLVGSNRVRVERLPHTIVEGFPTESIHGLPAQVEGIVIVDQGGAVINANRITPAPTLTLVRLARCYELRDTTADYERAVQLYDQASVETSVQPWSGFAMAHGGLIAAETLRDRKTAIALYKRAWDLEGRVKGITRTGLPLTWVQDSQTGIWSAVGLREAVGQRLDSLSSEGFWYKFVDTFVLICGGNAGLGLILLAVVTRLFLYPLTKKQIRSAREMQRLQPQIKALQEKYGADKQKFNEQFWKLCRENNVNPLGGCLPLLAQMPLLIMVYRGIQAYVVQLASHRFLWVPSLADPDLLLLVLYTVSMIAFQKLTMKTQPVSDPQQQQQQNMMVWMMPLMFFIFLRTLPSGFVLYWLGTNLIYLPQQYFGTRMPRVDEKTEGTGKEGASTGMPSAPEGNDEVDARKPWSLLEWVRKVASPKPQTNEGNPAPSYEEKQRQEKRKPRRPPRPGARSL